MKIKFNAIFFKDARVHPPKSGMYRAQFSSNFKSCTAQFTFDKDVVLGEQTSGICEFILPNLFTDLKLKNPFSVKEGNKIVAMGNVEEVIKGKDEE